MLRLKLCAADECETPTKNRARYCDKHRARLQRHGDVTVNLRDHPATCSVATCNEPYEARGLCNMHYLRVRITGSTELPQRMDRFLSHVRKMPDGCWLWTGARNDEGYGVFNSGEATVLAHRWAYEQFLGAIPIGLQLDHLCKNRRCVSPTGHLEPVTAAVNTARARGPALIECRCSD